MQDFTGPGTAVLGQLTTLIANNSADDRARVVLQAEKRRQMEKNFEVKSTLANQMMATDPNAALELFNDGLRGFGISVTMDQFRPAMKGFEVVADLMRNNDHQGAQMTLRSMKDRGMLTNLGDAQRALQLEQQTREGIAQQQTDTFLRLQHPEIDRAQKTVNAYRGFQQGTVGQEDINQLYGTTDPVLQGQMFAKDEAIVQGFEASASNRQTIQRAFENNPAIADDLIKGKLASRLAPESSAKARMSDLLQLPTRTEQQDRELNALASVYGSPQLQAALDLNTAANTKRQVMADLEEVGQRLGTLQETTGVLDAAEGAVASIDPKQAGLDSSKPMDEKAAADYAKRTTIRLGEGQKFLADNTNRLQQLDQAINGSQQQLETLSRSLVGAPAGRKAQLEQQQTDLTRTIEVSKAMQRLIANYNPYQLAAQEAAVNQWKTYGKRRDGTDKGVGYFGEVKRKDGKGFSTELSISTEFDGKKMDIPSMVPTLTKDELDSLVNDGPITDTIFNKAVDHARMRIAQGKSPYADNEENAQYKEASLTLRQMKKQREDDLALVNDESVRLQRRQRLLQGHMTKADRDEDVERRLNSASSAVVSAMGKGMDRTPAIRDGVSVYGVKPADLQKQVDAMFSDNETQAKTEFSLLPDSMQTSQNAGKIGKKWKVSPDKVLEGIKRPNTPLVQIGQEKAEAKTVGEGFGKQYSAIQEADMSSGNQLAKLDRMEQLMVGVQTGALAPAITQIQSIAASFGIEVDKTLGAKQAMESLTNEMALELRNPAGGAGMPGALSDKDREFLQSMTPGLSKTPEGNRMIIDTARKLAQRNREVGRMARAYRQKNGHFDEGFFEQLQAFSDAHPLFQQPDLSQYQEIRTTKDGRRLGKKADGTIEEIR